MPHLGGKRRRGATGEEHMLGRGLVGGADGRTEIASAIERDRPRALERSRDAVQERLVVRDERGEGARSMLGLRSQIEGEQGRIGVMRGEAR